MEQHLQNLQQRPQERETKIAQLAATVKELINTRNRGEQIANLAQAIQQLSMRNPAFDQKEKILKELRHMGNFNESGEVSINAFIIRTESYLNSINDSQIKREATRLIFYEKIHGDAKTP
ncbi:unnamed protein product [Hermetia illucens]|uniref:Uncharacterized protein n=1 Tax=Hermetia illucens TaxID=343691 RepID=A0A7R8Z0M5_HERIL|nr:unnamed protein product [Hermetia illucens]